MTRFGASYVISSICISFFGAEVGILAIDSKISDLLGSSLCETSVTGVKSSEVSFLKKEILGVSFKDADSFNE